MRQHKSLNARTHRKCVKVRARRTCADHSAWQVCRHLSLCLPGSDHSSHGWIFNRFESCEGRRPTMVTNSWRFRRIASLFSFADALWSHPSRPARRRTNNVFWAIRAANSSTCTSGYESGGSLGTAIVVAHRLQFYSFLLGPSSCDRLRIKYAFCNQGLPCAPIYCAPI